VKNKLLVATFLLNLINSQSASALEEYRIAAWNIADLYHVLDEEVRPGIGTKRSQSDFDTLKKYATQIDADVVALQEIATKEAADLLFSPAEYNVIMSSRYYEDINAGLENDIYTAVAVRKREDIRLIEQVDLSELQIDPKSDDPKDKPTRRGTAVKLSINGTELWILSVHLKSSCSSTKRLDLSVTNHCKILWEQRVPLTSWIMSRIAKGEHFIIAGDFNRRFRQLEDRGVFWSYLNGGELKNPLLLKYPKKVTRKCPTKKGNSTQPIDWIITSTSLMDSFVEGSFWETRWNFKDTQAHGRRLSDHCPIKIDMTF